MTVKYDGFPKGISGCGLIGIINRDKEHIPGEVIVSGIMNMVERGNGLGAGYAAYGIYPDFADKFALHLMFDRTKAQEETEHIIHSRVKLVLGEELPTRKVKTIHEHPYFWRYFVEVPEEKLTPAYPTPEDYIVKLVMDINEKVDGAFVVSSGRNMGAFKGVGNPDEIAEFFKIDEYSAHTWIAHTRFPTNTPGWWGGAHPFTILDWAIVHNREISSYGINKRYLEMHGYKCTLLTDTEVVAYALDLLLRKHKLPLRAAFYALASPFWKEIDHLKETDPETAEALEAIRMIYGPILLNGPFAIIFAFNGGMVAFNDRVKLRPLVAAEARGGKTVIVASEEAAIRTVEPNPDKVWTPRAGEPVIAFLEGEENA